MSKLKLGPQESEETGRSWVLAVALQSSSGVTKPLLTLSLPRVPKIKIQDRSQISFCKIPKYKIVPCESTTDKVLFEWSHHRISSTDSRG